MYSNIYINILHINACGKARIPQTTCEQPKIGKKIILEMLMQSPGLGWGESYVFGDVGIHCAHECVTDSFQKLYLTHIHRYQYMNASILTIFLLYSCVILLGLKKFTTHFLVELSCTFVSLIAK